LPAMQAALPNIDRLDYKTVLQEQAARIGIDAPVYSIESTGPDHEKSFTASVKVGTVSASGVGRSKKAAEQVAAEAASHSLSAAFPDA